MPESELTTSFSSLSKTDTALLKLRNFWWRSSNFTCKNKMKKVENHLKNEREKLKKLEVIKLHL